MANTTSSRRRRGSRAPQSFERGPEKLRPLRYKTALGLAFEALAAKLGLPPAEAPTLTTYQWKGPRAA